MSGPRLLLTLLGFFALCSVSAAAAPAKPAGLVLELEGTSSPAIEAFDEVTTKTSLDLGKDARIVFQHYQSCDEVTIIGGQLAFTERRYLVRGGEVVDVARGQCPDAVDLTKSSSVGGVVLRSGFGAKKLAPTPTFVLIGGDWSTVAAVRVLSGDAVIAELKPEGREVPWPKELAALESGAEYKIELTRTEGGAPEAKTAKVRKNANTLMLIRID